MPERYGRYFPVFVECLKKALMCMGYTECAMRVLLDTLVAVCIMSPACSGDDGRFRCVVCATYEKYVIHLRQIVLAVCGGIRVSFTGSG